MSDIYIVLLEDRHTDVDAYPFLEEQEAIAYARELVDANAHHPERIREEQLSFEMKADGWVFCMGYSSEGDLVRVIRRELGATP